jgi:hypothetical protein
MGEIMSDKERRILGPNGPFARYERAHSGDPASVAAEEALSEPTLDELWQAIADSLAAAGADKLAIYRGGVPAPEALASIQKHESAGLAARVMYDRLVARSRPASVAAEEARDDGRPPLDPLVKAYDDGYMAGYKDALAAPIGERSAALPSPSDD